MDQVGVVFCSKEGGRIVEHFLFVLPYHYQPGTNAAAIHSENACRAKHWRTYKTRPQADRSMQRQEPQRSKCEGTGK
jgi:hypothetical protein